VEDNVDTRVELTGESSERIVEQDGSEVENNVDTIEVFTDESFEHIIAQGGSGEWLLDPVRAKECTWLVCTQNRKRSYHESAAPTAPHKAGFLLGKISGLGSVTGKSTGNRWMIKISEYAALDDRYPNLWDGGRNPRRYTSLTALGIRRDGLEFQPIQRPSVPPLGDEPPGRPEPGPSASSPAMLTIPAAKKALAATFGVKPEDIEITIRG
jgi:hypothetical protein